MGTEHDRTVRTEFRRQSPTFEAEDSFFADPRLAGWVSRHLEPLDRSALVLEVACGAAHQGEAVAPQVGRVVGADLTPELLAVARRRLADHGVDRVVLTRADATGLPFPDDSFDLTFCRFAVHHFAEPAAPLAEMVRVSRPGGRVAVIDLISADPQLAVAYNDVERRRDPSHTRALTTEELEAAIARAGAAVEHTTRVDVRAPVERWLTQASTPADVAAAIRAELDAELAGGPPTGMRPVDDGGLHYTQTWEIAVGRVVPPAR
ncbi:MAG TPA: methyltransferase domain-containing protein [Acidimicrobiia bacterium]|nr:methyltransferase domain-containing protein [Acidimicrobiia bacterium]